MDGLEGHPAEPDSLAILKGRDLRGGDGLQAAPQQVHGLAVDPLGRAQQLGGVRQMDRAPGVDVDPGPVAGQTPCGTGVVEVDVGEEDVAHVRQGEPLGLQGRFEMAGQGFRPRLHEDGALLRPDQEGADGALRLEAEVQQRHRAPRIGAIHAVSLGEGSAPDRQAGSGAEGRCGYR
jgi:hypothetical protein